MRHSENNVGLSLSIINRAALSYFTKALEPLHISPGMQAYLLIIEDEEILTQEAIAKRLRIDKANVTRAMKSLEQLSLITRKIDKKDQRKNSHFPHNGGSESKK